MMYKLLIPPFLVLGCLWLGKPAVALAPEQPIVTPMEIMAYTEVETVEVMSITESYTVYCEEEDPEEYIMETEISDEDFDLLTDIVMAEAENQSWDAQYAVACVVLNRMKSDLFPNTISEVVYQKKPRVQFSPTVNGRLREVAGKSSDSVKEAVESALQCNELPGDVLYFTSIGYLGNTDPYKKIDGMYFSKQR